MERRSENRVREFLPEEEIQLALIKITEAKVAKFNGNNSKASRLEREAKKLAWNAFGSSSREGDFRIMGLSGDLVIRIEKNQGNHEDVVNKGRVVLNALGERAPEFSERIMTEVIKSKQEIEK